MPFLAILMAGMIAAAASAGFEWLYPLRLVSAAAALWIFRKSYAGLNCPAGWLAPVTGAAVFAIWIGVDWIARLRAGQTPDPGMPAALIAFPAAQLLWITARVTAAVVTVPMAEELAFRGFLMRRFISRDFES